MIKPTGHKILVKPDPVEETTESGIVVSVGQGKRLEEAGQQLGTLVDAGPQAWKAFSKDFTGEPWASIGDRVLFSKYAGLHVEDPEDGNKYIILNDEDLVAIIKE